MARDTKKHKHNKKVIEDQNKEQEFDWTEEDLSETQIFQWLGDEELFLEALAEMPGYTDEVDLDDLGFTDFANDDEKNCGNDDCNADCAPKAHHHHKHHHHHHNNGEELVAAQEVGGE